jgi:hypothetical protein
MVVALAALAVALGGTAVASTVISSRDIKDGSIAVRDLSPAVRSQLGRVVVQGPAGSPGPAGAPGAAGATGARGGFDLSKLTSFWGPDTLILAGTIGSAFAYCPAGQKPTGGGFFSGDTHVGISAPVDGGWQVVVNNTTGVDYSVSVFVVCAAA